MTEAEKIAQPQPGGEALVEAVARALMDERLFTGAFDRAFMPFGSDAERDGWRSAARAAIAALQAHAPGGRAAALEEAAAVCDGVAETATLCGDSDGASTAAFCTSAIRALVPQPPAPAQPALPSHGDARGTLGAPEPPPHGWQPIATAPRDGTEFLVAFPEFGVQQVAWTEATNGAEGWCVDDGNYGPLLLRGWNSNPTHWQPLPAPPAGAGA